MKAFYREGAVFAMLPDKKALRSATSIAYKVNDSAKRRAMDQWNYFELMDSSQITNARLQEAFEAAAA